jgi:hypothetical protein
MEIKNTAEIDVGKRKCRAAVGDRIGWTFVFGNDKDGIDTLTEIRATANLKLY